MNTFLKVCGISFLGATSLWAQKPTNDSTAIQYLDEVVVSDSRFELRRENSGKTVIRIGPEELARYRGATLPEILNTKSGIEISGSRGRPGEVLGVYARGGRGRQVLVLIDGVRVTDPSSSSQEFDLRLLPPEQIASVEIIKGASSTLYGTNAATAVISIKTKQPADDTFELQAGSSLGTNQPADSQQYTLSSFSNHARLGGRLGWLEYQAGLSQSYSDQLSSLDTPGREEDPFSRYRASFRLGYRGRDSLALAVFGNQSHFRSAYDESFGMTDAPYFYTAQQKQLGASLQQGYSHGELIITGAFNEFFSENVSAFPGTFTGSSQTIEAYNKYILAERWHSLVGLSYVRDRATFGEAEDFTILDPYLNLVYVSPWGLNVNTGTRLNTHSEYGNQWVYNFNPSYSLRLQEGYMKFMGTFATSYITPSLTQLFGEFGANPELEPETDRTLEAGVEWQNAKNFRASLLGFFRKEENFVFFDSNSFLYRNAAGTIRASGLEAEIQWKASGFFWLEANYTFTERKGDDAIRIPKHKVNAELGLTPGDGFQALLGYSYTGSRPDTDFGTFETVQLEAFSLVHLYLSRDFMQGKLNVFLRAENLLNEEYTEVLGFLTRGRNIRLGCSLEL